LPHWNWQGSGYDQLPVFVYTNGDCAELFLNGKSLGLQCKKPNSSKSVDRFRLMWNNVKFEPGELKAVAYREGKLLGEKVIRTAGDPYQIKLSPDRNIITADGMDLSYILIEAVDKDGNLCPLADNLIKISLSGPVKIAGVGNGNPQSVEEFQADQIRLFYGKAMLIVKSGYTRGDAKVTATADHLGKQIVSITVK
jgi:beta-galactosidase